eukprot:scaffold2957_cov57-Cyclotella_meneghiniana.AAC.2
MIGWKLQYKGGRVRLTIRGELLSLMAIHLILLAVNKTWTLSRRFTASTGNLSARSCGHVAVIVGRDKLTSDDILRFLCQQKEAKEVLSDQKKSEESCRSLLWLLAGRQGKRAKKTHGLI